MATDNFSATNDPLASPWVSVSGAGTLKSTGGQAIQSSAGTESAMVYSTSTELYSEIIWATDQIGGGGGGADFLGPALFNSSNGNGYFWQPFGTSISVVQYNSFAYASDNGGTTFTVVVGDTMAIEIDGDDIVAYVNSVERARWTNTNHRTGLKPGIWIGTQFSAVDDWTDGAGGGGAALSIAAIMQNYRNMGLMH